MYTNMSFGQALVYLQAGVPCRRSGWRPITPAVGAPFVFKQVPSEVPAAIIPKMTSLPQQVKDLVVARGLPLRYDNQFARVSADNEVSGYAPAPEDLLANDWEAIHPFSVAGETVGTAVIDPNVGRCPSPSYAPLPTAVEPSDWAKTVTPAPYQRADYIGKGLGVVEPPASTSVSQLAAEEPSVMEKFLEVLNTPGSTFRQQAAAVTADALGANDEESGNTLALCKD